MKIKLHIATTIGRIRPICGERGESKVVPTEANCEKCIKLFKSKYPVAWAEWLEKEERENEGN